MSVNVNAPSAEGPSAPSTMGISLNDTFAHITLSTPASPTNPPTTGSACQAVFQTAELLENIIVHLPAKNIFGTLRVSSAFRDCVATSPGIQEKLFLRLKRRPRETSELVADFENHTAGDVRPPSKIEDSARRQKHLTSIHLLMPCLRKLGQIKYTWTLVNYLIPSGGIHKNVMNAKVGAGPDLLITKWIESARSSKQLSVMDSYFSDPPSHRILVHLEILMISRAGIRYRGIGNNTWVAGGEALTPRNALMAALNKTPEVRRHANSHKLEANLMNMFRRLSKPWWKTKSVLQVIKVIEAEGEFTAAIAPETYFFLKEAEVHSEAEWAAIALQSEVDEAT